MIVDVEPKAVTRTPMESLWPPRVWPRRAYRAASPRVLLAAIAAGVAGAILLGAPGIAYPLTAIAVTGVVLVAARRRPTAWGVAGAAAVLALVSVAAFRTSEWLVTLSLWLAVIVAGAVACRGRTWIGLALGALVPLFVPARLYRWCSRGARDVRAGELRAGRVVAVLATTAVLVVVFVTLFAGADPVFARAVDAVTPRWRSDVVVARTVLFALVTLAALTAAYVVGHPPRFDVFARKPRSRVRLWEWAIPLGALVAVFCVFVAVQAATLFGGQEHVLVTDGLTNAEYARQGFWQLLTVTGLTLVVLAVTVRKASRETRRDRVVLRALLGALCLLSLVVVASALHRMSLYEEQYGYTTLRLFVTAVELLLGGVFVLVLIAGVSMSGRWLPRAVGVAVVATVLGLALLNPDAYVARHNVDRFVETGEIDTRYLAELSADATGELDRLPEPYRSCVLPRVEPRRWNEWNVADSRARTVLDGRPVLPCPSVR
ncbi:MULTISPECIES: DUF4153 domain-containing protein [Nocardiaceae]|nr:MULTISPECIES: DUF4173 domain-containing protein [Rhodococcus]NIL77198.1 hypothetical protein [Rhodococcus sp. B10]